MGKILEERGKMDLNMNVLVVSDSSPIRNLLKAALKHSGFNNIIETESGIKALQELEKGSVDLILAEWDMPKIKGIDLLKKVRSDQSFSDIPFIMVVPELKRGHVDEALKAGVSSIIVKPFASETLKKKIQTVFNLKQVGS